MSTLGNIYLAMEKDKSELERVLEIFNLSKQIKYIYDEKNKLVPIDRISKIGKGVCFDHARYKSSLAKKYKLTSRTFFYVCYVDGKLAEDEITPGVTHAENFILADGKWYMLSTTGNRKQLYACDIDKLDIVVAGITKNRSRDIVLAGLTLGATGKDISSTVASNMVAYFNQYQDHVTEEVYEIPNFHDKKFDGMTYKKLAEYVISHYSPYVFDDKIIEGIRKDDPKYNMWTVLKEVA
jgi:hypothetical protein